MLRRSWKPIATATFLIGTPGYIYYKSKQSTFDLAVRVRGSDGKPAMSTRTFSLLSSRAITERLTEKATSNTKTLSGGITWKHTTASVAANDPIEDAFSDAVIKRDQSDPSAPGDWLFFTVMDGHSGPHTSRLLSKTLINAVVLELSGLIQAGKPRDQSQGLLASIRSYISRPSAPATGETPESVSLAIQNAFTKLDSELINAPLAILAAHLREQGKDKVLPDLSQHPLGMPSMLPAVSGSCALLAMFDTAHNDLYVACSGDSRAVAGIWKEDASGKGSWRVEVLTEDQTGRNPSELKRIQSEHPPDEAPDVIRAGRVLGGLEPTRAFGDARYKWPRDVQAVLSEVFLAGNGQPLRPPPSTFKTPPYVTATPVVTHRRMSFNASSLPSGRATQFVVFATDGLWDKLSSEEVVALVGGHLAGLKGSFPKASFGDVVSTTIGTRTVEGKDKERGSHQGSWAFVDENVSSHLIRNAFGGGDESDLRRMLSIPAPFARSYRDDTTVTVVWWEKDGQPNTTTFSADKLKSKL